MSSWILVPCLAQLRAEFDRIAPARAKGADGSIGDQAHADRTSDHNPDETGAVPVHDADKINEVHALDITTALNESDLTLEKCVQFILGRCRRDSDDPLNEARLRYIIFNRRIWRAPLWKQETYTLDDPHTGHAHFSAEYITSLEYDTSTWHLEEIPVALTPADKLWLTTEMDEAADRAALKLRRSQDPGWSDTAAHNLAVDTARMVGGKTAAEYWGDRTAENAPAKK
jgi:hypothetical protein